MNVHIVSFPKWKVVADCTRTVFHLPLKNLKDPPYRVGDYLMCVSVDRNASNKAVVARIKATTVGQLMSFIGDPDAVSNRGCTKELGKVGYDWAEFQDRWRCLHGELPMGANPEVLRVEFEYEPMPLSEQTTQALQKVKTMLSNPAEEALIDLAVKASRDEEFVEGGKK